MKGGKWECLWAHPFFGLSSSDRQIIHSQIFDLIYHGNGGFTFSDVYNMPIWARKYYIKQIVDFKKEQKKAYDDQAKKIKSLRK